MSKKLVNIALIENNDGCGTLKCENCFIREKVAKYENVCYLYSKCENIRLSKCIKHFDSKCLNINTICANFILTLFVKICFCESMHFMIFF